METKDKFLGLNSIKFTLWFHEDEPCYKYLSEIKWENGYHCKKCNHTGYCSKDADVVTDEWTGYIPLKNDYKKLKQVPSNKGENQPDMHIHIMNLKGWLRGIHHIAVRKDYKAILRNIILDTIDAIIWTQSLIPYLKEWFSMSQNV